MGKTLPLVFILCTAGWNALAAQRVAPRAATSAGSTVESALRKLDDAELAGIQRRDAKFVDDVYAPNAVVFPYYLPLKLEGREEARTAWQSFFDRFATITKNQWTERVYHSAGPASAWMTCLWHLEGTNSDGQAIELNLRVTRQYEKRQGRWMVVHEHFSAPER